MLTLSAAEARRFLVRRHLLAPPRALPARPQSVLAVLARLGSLQFDPLEVPGARNHDLVLHARVAGYRRAWCDQWLYGPAGARRLFEAYNKSLNILPIDELPYYRLAWARAAARYKDGILREQAAVARGMVRRLRQEGPLSTAQASRDLTGSVAWHWAPTSLGRAVLEAMFESGRVGIARRDGSGRIYDLIERLFPAELLARRVSVAASLRHRLLSRHRGIGLMGGGGGSEITTGTGSASERAALVARLVAEGVIVPAAVEGVKGVRYVLAEELGLLAEAGAPPPAVTFLAPLDPLIWDRRLVRDLFSFDYRWEVYTPAARRVHGYYVLPVLFGDRLVGRIEPRLARATATLHIASLGFEPGFDPRAEPGFPAALGAALADYQDFVGARRVTWTRTRLAAWLRTAMS